MEYVTADGIKKTESGICGCQMDTQTTHESVSTALELGYRHVDTAQLFENEAGVGTAIEESDVISGGYSPLANGGAFDDDHLAQNIDIFDFKLTRAEHDRIIRPSYLRTGLAIAKGQFGL